MAESAGILYRASSDGQDEQNQVPELEGYCYDQNYRINRRYQLHDKSAYHGEQEEALAGILDDISTGVISVLVVVHSSRIDRRDPDIAEYYHLSVRRAGGRVESVREPLFGKSDISGRVITMLAQSANHEYSRTLAGHIRAGHNRVRTNRTTIGKGLLGRAPWGYEVRGEKYYKIAVPSSLGLKYVPEMFDRIISGESLAAVAAWLNAEGVPTGCKVGRDKNHVAVPGKVPEWTASTVGQIIRNTVYKGQMRDTDGNFVCKCEPIVSSAVFNAAGKRLDRSPKRGPQNNTNKAMLTSVLFCECGSPMYRSTSEGVRHYYRCTGKVTGKSCFMVRVAVIDDAVNGIMSANTYPVMEMRLIPGRNYDDEIDLIRSQVRSLDLDDPEYDERHDALMAERSRLKDLDTTPDRWEMQATGETWGQLWNGLERAGRGRWLMARGFTVRASRTLVTVTLAAPEGAVTAGGLAVESLSASVPL